MRNRPNLFEVMNKAPQSQPSNKTRKMPLLGGLRRNTSASQPLVAQALTEEEAALELDRRRAAVEAEARVKAEAHEKALREKEAKKQAKLEKKAAKAAAREIARQQAAELAVKKAAERAAARQAMVPMPESKPVLRAGRGKFAFSMSTAGCMVAAGVLCAVLFGVYRLGIKSGNDRNSVQLVDSPQSPPSDSVTLAALTSAPAKHAKAGRVKKQNDAEKGNELDELLKPPASVMQNVMANQPVRIDQPQGNESPDKIKLNYVQIEWFQITVQKTGEDLRAELEEAHRFLKEKGIDTFARETSRGFILYSATGFRMSRDARTDRDAFLKKIEKMGQEYFRGGGRYQFKDCFFVSHNNAMKGRPVSFKE